MDFITNPTQQFSKKIRRSAQGIQEGIGNAARTVGGGAPRITRASLHHTKTKLAASATAAKTTITSAKTTLASRFAPAAIFNPQTNRFADSAADISYNSGSDYETTDYFDNKEQSKNQKIDRTARTSLQESSPTTTRGSSSSMPPERRNSSSSNNNGKHHPFKDEYPNGDDELTSTGNDHSYEDFSIEVRDSEGRGNRRRRSGGSRGGGGGGGNSSPTIDRSMSDASMSEGSLIFAEATRRQRRRASSIAGQDVAEAFFRESVVVTDRVTQNMKLLFDNAAAVDTARMAADTKRLAADLGHKTKRTYQKSIWCSPVRFVGKFPKKWPRLFNLGFGVVLPIWFLIFLAAIFGSILAFYESDNEIETNDSILAARAILERSQEIEAELLTLPQKCIQQYFDLIENYDNTNNNNNDDDADDDIIRDTDYLIDGDGVFYYPDVDMAQRILTELRRHLSIFGYSEDDLPDPSISTSVPTSNIFYLTKFTQYHHDENDKSFDSAMTVIDWDAAESVILESLINYYDEHKSIPRPGNLGMSSPSFPNSGGNTTQQQQQEQVAPLSLSTYLDQCTNDYVQAYERFKETQEDVINQAYESLSFDWVRCWPDHLREDYYWAEFHPSDEVVAMSRLSQQEETFGISWREEQEELYLKYMQELEDEMGVTISTSRFGSFAATVTPSSPSPNTGGTDDETASDRRRRGRRRRAEEANPNSDGIDTESFDNTTIPLDLQLYLDEEWEVFRRSVNEASGGSTCDENIAGTAWFFFTIMTTLGYGNQAPSTEQGRMLIYTAGIASLILYGAILGFSGYVMLAIFDDLVSRFYCSKFLRNPLVGVFLWGFIFLLWSVLIATDAFWWWDRRLLRDPDVANAETNRSDAMWFAFISTSTIGLGDYYLNPEVMFGSDAMKFSIEFLLGFVFLANFFGKISEFLSSFLPRRQNSLEARLKATNLFLFWPSRRCAAGILSRITGNPPEYYYSDEQIMEDQGPVFNKELEMLEEVENIEGLMDRVYTLEKMLPRTEESTRKERMQMIAGHSSFSSGIINAEAMEDSDDDDDEDLSNLELLEKEEEILETLLRHAIEKRKFVQRQAIAEARRAENDIDLITKEKWLCDTSGVSVRL